MKKYFAIVLLALLLASCSQKVKEIQKPNIVFILCDDLGYGDIRANAPGYGKIPTPYTDKLISEGVRFTNAHSGSAVCTPTRYGLLTGRYSWRTTLQKGVVGAEEGPMIAEDRMTVASFLKEQGYNTGAVGKWHLNYTYLDAETKERLTPTNKKSAGVPVGTIIPDGPVSRGFDYFYGFHHIGSMKTVVENDKVIRELNKMEELLPLLTENAVAYVNKKASEAKDGKPFFLYVPLSSPHGPLVPTKEWIGKSGINLFGDFVMQTDWSIGQIMNAVNENGLTDNTIFIVSSDNGTSAPVANFKELKSKGHYSVANFRGSKADIWEGGHRIPLIVRWPNGKVPAQTQNDQLTCLTDFMPTCADILGVSLPGNAAEDGISFLPALYGKPMAQEREAIVHHSSNGKFAIRKGSWKLILCSGSGGWSAPSDKKADKSGLPKVQLYNLETDMEEKVNLQAEHPEVVEELTALLEEYVKNGRSTPGEVQENDAPIDIWKNEK